MHNREGYQFPKDLRRQLLKQSNGVCESCQQFVSEEELTVHHILPIFIARDFYPNIPPSIVRSALNAMCLCKRCHSREDELALLPEQIEFILPILLHAVATAEDDATLQYLAQGR